MAKRKADLNRFGSLGEIYGLNDREELFVREYLKDLNETKAYVRAGYSAKTARNNANKLMAKANIRKAIEALLTTRAERLGIDTDELLKTWAATIHFDVNEIMQLRRVCCPYCHGKNHNKQYTPAGLESAKKWHDKERFKRLKDNPDDDIGEFPVYTDNWYDKQKDPSPDCPECFGDGIAEIYHADTRKLSAAGKLVYCGVKDGKDGIEFILLSKEKALENLAKALGLYRESETTVNVESVSVEELSRRYDEIMRKANERQQAVLKERGIKLD